MQSVVKTRSRVALGDEHLLQVRQQRRPAGTPREHERAPGDPQRDAERRLVRPVAADVADDGVDACRRGTCTAS